MVSSQLLTAFEVERDVKNLRNAMKGVGTDEQTLVEILGGRTPQQMVQIINGYKKAYETTLSSALSEEYILGNFGNLCMGLVVPILEYDLSCVHDAMNGWFGSNDSVLIEVLVGRTEKDMGIIKTAYVAKYGKEIEDDVRDNLSGDFRDLFLAILTKNDPNEPFNVDEDVEALYKAGDGKKWHRNKETFINILAHRNDKQLNKIFYEYEKKYNKPFLSAIRDNFTGNLQHALANIAKSAMNRVQLIAELFENSVYGISTKHTKLIRLVIRHRSPQVMKLIKESYKNLYGISLEERIDGESRISGMYKELLMKIIRD